MRALSTASRKKLYRLLEAPEPTAFVDHCLTLHHLGFDLSRFFDGAEEAYGEVVSAGLTQLATTQSGFIYLAANPVYGRDLYKIGKTRKQPHERMASLETAGVLGSFVLAAHWPSRDLDRTEGRCHARFEALRVDGEFFSASYPALMAGIDVVLREEAQAFETLARLLVTYG